MERETGGQAFPQQQWEYDGQNNVLQYQKEGMTLRDYFAAKAMQGMLSAHVPSGDIPAWSYEIADAMLDARAISKATGE
ncbi:hypothetical protein [Buttiauxella noackiae]|uniref:hypothetical protein n=1 Tax=Buttiauxella noackiae TaxID=82992 RepID=UPI0028D15AE7|nr:hypothetical protein [Buttiauxella noackiae]